MSTCVKQTKMENNKKNIVEIYTDWANHYLEKTKGKHKIKSLQSELSDGLLLTEVIEAVTHQKVPDIQRKPKNKDAMVTNIQACLNFLLAKGVAVEEIRADEIHDGNMKAILGLFFQLSRYKQQQKAVIQPPSSASSSPAKHGLSSIPVPGSSQHNSPKKLASQLASPGLGKANKLTEGTKPPLVKRDGMTGPAKQSMLQKFRSNLPSSPRQVGLGKRTSSSSGFSSARSDRSESSVSVSSDTNFPSPAAIRRIQENEHIKQMDNNIQNNARNSLRSKLTKPESYRLQREKSSSPKRSPKPGRHKDTEIKDYGPIDGDKNYPPHAYSRSNSGISLKHTNISSGPAHNQSKLRMSAVASNGVSGIPSPRGKPPAPPVRSGESRRSSEVSSQPTEESDLVKSPQAELNTVSGDSVSSNQCQTEIKSKAEPCVTRTCSLPRQKRMGDCSSPSQANVAVVSPMPIPHMTKSASVTETGNRKTCCDTQQGQEHGDEALKGIAPMPPLGTGISRRNSNPRCGFSPYESHNIQTLNSGGLNNGDNAGYQSDGDLVRARSSLGQTSGYTSDNNFDRRAHRLAYEQQRARAEAEHRQYLHMSGKIRQDGGKPTYKVTGARKNVKKSDSGIQTETGLGEDHWRAAMEHNKAVLASQEQEMKEYLRRQQRVAEKHIKQFSPALSRKTCQQLETMSMPGTPMGNRRNKTELGETRLHDYGYISRGGSLERQRNGLAEPVISEAYSDTEYIKTDSDRDQRLAKLNGSKILPKKSSALNYGLLLGQIQQKRQQRKNKSVDGSVSDSNYTSYGEIKNSYGKNTWSYSSCQEDMGSNESLDSVSSSIKQARAHSLNRSKQENETEYYGVPFMLQRNRINENKNLVNTCPTYSSLPPDINTSHVSLVSNGSSVYSSQEDKTNADIVGLRRELMEEHKKVVNLTSQLATNAHVVSAFEQSLANMTSRLHQITRTAEKKDSELAELRQTIERLRQSGADAGLIKNKRTEVERCGGLLRQESGGSVASLSSALSSTSINSDTEAGPRTGTKNGVKRSGWLRSSFSKAFAKHKTRNKSGSVSDCEDSKSELPSIDTRVDTSVDSTVEQSDDEEVDPEIVNELRKQLIEKDTLLTETRLEALSSVHQLESLKETVNKMRTELTSLKQDNEKLQCQAANKSLGSSESSLNTSNNDMDPDKRMSVNTSYSESSVTTCGGQPSSLDMSATTDPSNCDSKSISIVVEAPSGHIKIGTIAASGKLSWALLDGLVERLFSEYLMLVDPVTNLGLAAESVKSYKIGEIVRRPQDVSEPELLPYGYIIGDIKTISLSLSESATPQVDVLAFETLIPKSIMQRYASLVKEHKHVIICGPPTTGKSKIARKLANFVSKGDNTGIVTFSLTREKSDSVEKLIEDVKAEGKCDIFIIDNLQNAENIDTLLQTLSSTNTNHLPYIIGTMTQSSGSTTDLQLKCNFRWILFANHIEPVRGYLGRQLRRKLLAVEVECRQHNTEMYQVIEWISKSFMIINKFLESHCSQDATLSPATFLSLPLESSASRLWFINLWNLNIVPHVLDSVREGLIMYGKRSSWDDPVKFMRDTWPWSTPPSGLEDLTHVRPEDVGYDPSAPFSTGSSRPMSSVEVSVETHGPGHDPLFNMLMTLQEAANTQPGQI